MIVNADSTCDQCAFDALQHFRKTGFIMKHMYEINVQHQSLQKLDPQKTLANENNWQRWIRCITCSIKRSAHPNKCLTNNMARQGNNLRTSRRENRSTQHDRRNSLFCVFDMFKKFGQRLWDVWASLFCVFEMAFWDVCAKRKLAPDTNHCKN